MKNFVLLSLLCAFLTACGSDPSTDHNSPLTPMPTTKPADPPNSALQAPMAQFLRKQNAPTHSEWDLVRTDLNGDGRRDAIVLFKLPHNYWCGWDGCGMLILRATDKSFVPLSTVNNVRGPIFVSDQKTNNWRDILIRVTGTTMPDRSVVLEFDGTTYPRSPMLAGDLEVPVSVLNTERFFR